MSRYYGYRRPYRSRRTTFFGSPPLPSRPTKTFSVETYLKNEFLNADSKTFAKIAGLYRKLYGDRAYRYMLETHASWKYGYVRVSGQTMHRILQCVPKYLSDDKRFYILKNEIIYFIETLHHKHKHKPLTLFEINQRFEEFAQSINDFNEVDLKWFVGKKIFPEEEIESFLRICRHALSKRLASALRQVQNDLALISDALVYLPPNKVKATYEMDFLQSTVDLADLVTANLRHLSLSVPDIKAEGQFKDFAEQFVVEEFMKLRFSEQEGTANRQIKETDLTYAIQKFQDLVAADEEASIACTFKGEGGTLSLNLEVKSLGRIKFSLYTSALKIIALLALVGVATKLYLTYKPYEYNCFLLIGALFVLSLLYNEAAALYSHLKDFREHRYTYAK